MKGESVSQICLKSEDVARRVDRGKPVDVVLFDLQKAFDKVPCKRQEHKLRM